MRKKGEAMERKRGTEKDLTADIKKKWKREIRKSGKLGPERNSNEGRKMEK